MKFMQQTLWQHEYEIKPGELFGWLTIDIGQTLLLVFISKVALSQARCLRVPASLVASFLPFDPISLAKVQYLT